MNSWHSYPSIYALGHRYIMNLLDDEVNVEEKVDGSQFSFGVNEAGEILARSKGAVLNADAPERMFERALNSVKSISHLLTPGWTYRAEYLQKPKHNSLAYSRVPKLHLIIFDINDGHESYLSYEDKAAEADRVGLEVVPLLFSGMVPGIDHVRGWLDRESILGGQKIEGVVVKRKAYNLFGADKKSVIGKFVSEAFKEVHAREWKASNAGPVDLVTLISSDLKTTARWQKAVLHLQESGVLEGSPRDIGPLMKEVPQDIESDSQDFIKQKLYEWAWPHIRRKVIAGLPEWYKDQLLQQQFAKDETVA